MGDATTLYATEAAYLAYLGGTAGSLTAGQSAELLDACRVWDRLCGVPDGWFVSASSVHAKTFDVSDPLSLWVDAIATDTGVIVKIDDDGDRTFETTLSASLDYYLEPVEGPPYTSIVIDRTNGRYRFPVGQRRVEVTAKHGWATAAPWPVRRAVLLIAKRYGVRKNTPEGILSGGSEHMMRLAAQDPDVLALLSGGGYRRRGGFA